MAFKVSDFAAVFKGYKLYVNGTRLSPSDADKDARAVAIAFPKPQTKRVYIVVA